MKILVIQLKMIGDVLASSIICNNLKSEYPDAQIDYLVYPFTVPVVENNPNIDNLVLFEDRFVKSKWQLLKFILKIRKQKYDVVIDAYGKLESYAVVLASGAKTKVGWKKKNSNFLFTNTLPEVKKSNSNIGLALENRLLLLKPFLKSADFDPKPKIFLTPEEIALGKKMLEKFNINSSEKIYMISVLGSGENKTYPLPFMAKILDFIAEKTHATLLFNYIPSQLVEAKSVYNLCNDFTKSKIIIDLVPGNLREFMAVTYQCNALIGNEGGAVNMAKALNIPTFTIFSTWINKEAWNSFEDGKTNISVHLKDFKPELYGEKSPKEMKEKAMDLYQNFNPELILPALEKYMEIN